MKLIISDEARLDKWEMLIETIDKSDIPIEFVNNLNITFKEEVEGRVQLDVEVQKLRNHGWTDEDIEEIIQQVITENHNNIQSIYFFLDVEHVADVVQRQTDKILKDAK